MKKFDRRDFLKLAGLGGGVVFASGLVRLAGAADRTAGQRTAYDEFYFV